MQAEQAWEERHVRESLGQLKRSRLAEGTSVNEAGEHLIRAVMAVQVRLMASMLLMVVGLLSLDSNADSRRSRRLSQHHSSAHSTPRRALVAAVPVHLTPARCTPLTAQRVMASSSPASSSSSSPSSSPSPAASLLPSTAPVDLSFVLRGADPARLLASIEDEQQLLRRLHALLVQQQSALQQEEQLIRHKIARHSEEQPQHHRLQSEVSARDREDSTDGLVLTEQHERMLEQLDHALSSRRR